MADMICPQCHRPVGAEDAAFCPFCGEKLRKGGPDLSVVRGEPDPVKKHEMLLALMAQHPDSLEVAEEILYLGRLYDRSRKGLDFSVIKCYVFNVYLDPDEMKPERREALRAEIFDHPDLSRCLELSGDREVFLRRYLLRIAEEFVRLFLKGSTRYMRSIFGFTNEGKAPKYLALPVARMLRAMQRDESLTGERKTLLMQALYCAFQTQLGGETRYLDELLTTYQIAVPQ
jgi:hypothetical protein